MTEACRPYPPSPTVGPSVNGTTFEEDWSRTHKTSAINRVNLLESLLFDRDEHLRRGMTGERAEELLGEINALRYKLGWLHLDLHHNPVWPEIPGR